MSRSRQRQIKFDSINIKDDNHYNNCENKRPSLARKQSYNRLKISTQKYFSKGDDRASLNNDLRHEINDCGTNANTNSILVDQSKMGISSVNV